MNKIAIVGCGGMGTYHAGELGKTEGVELIAVCDGVPEKADALARKTGVRPCYDFHEILNDVDIIWDCTPPFVRPKVVIECARAGKHVFSEKPLALNLEAADQIVEAVQEAGITFMVGYVLRFFYTYKIAHDAFASGELGQLVNVWSRRFGHTDTRSRWFGDQEKSGGVALDFASHDVDLLRWFGGEVKTILGHVDRIRDGIQADECVQALLIFEEGVGSVDVAWWAPVATSTFGVVGTRGSIVSESPYRIRKRIDGQEEVVLDGEASVMGKTENNDGQESATWPGGTLHEHFMRCVKEGTTPLVSSHEARAALEIVLTIQESARTGRSIDL